MKVIPVVEDLLLLNILLYDIDIMDGELSENLIRRRNVQKHGNTGRVLG